MKTLYLDCFCGISGDMAVAALVDVGADPSYLRDVAASLGLDGVEVGIDRVIKHGIQATRFQVQTDPHAHQPHRHLSHILEIIQHARMDEAAKEAATAVFQRIGQAEAAVHGIPVERVHFHEVGAVDSIMDIVLANAALYSLGIGCVLCSPLVVGSGSVACEHGVMPVPAPATALLLQGLPWSAGDIQGEMATPTGVALAAQWSVAFTPMPAMVTQATGYGAGTRDLPDRANVLRVFVGEQAERIPELEPITVLETTIDDMNPELTALLTPELLQAGARDVFVAPVAAKKGRIAQHVVVLAAPEKARELARLIFMHTTSLGVRIREERRWVLDRETRHVKTPWGVVKVKIGLLDKMTTVASPEFEDCLSLARDHGIAARTVYETALAAAVKGDFVNE